MVATYPGCVYVVDGHLLGVYELNDGSFTEIPASNAICVDGETILRLKLSDNVYLSLPTAEVVPRSTFLSSVSWKNYAGHTFLSITPLIWPLFLLLLLLAGAVVFYLWGKKRAQTSDIEGQIISFVAENPGCTQKDICKALGLEKYQVSRILSRLEKGGKIIRVRRGISKRVYLPDQLQ